MKYFLIILLILGGIILYAWLKIRKFLKRFTSPFDNMQNNINNQTNSQQYNQEQINDEVLYSKDDVTVLKGEAKKK